MTHTIWLDLTDFHVWQGHLTGIQRVIYNFARELAANTSNARFFVHDPRSATFRDFDFAELPAARPAAESPPPAPARNPARDALLRLRAQLKQRVSYMTRQDLHAVREATQRILLRARPALPRRSRRVATSTALFRPGDVVLVLGNFWARPALLEALRAAKAAGGFQLYLMIYDLIPIYLPQLFPEQIREQYANALRHTAELADRLLAISHNSRRDMERFCAAEGLTAPPIDVVRLGDELEAVTRRHPPAAVTEPGFVLCVGTIEIRKNHTLLYYTWKEALRRNVELPPLVIVGQSGWYAGDVQHLLRNDPDLRGRVHILSNVGDAELAWLYENCSLTVFPSMYEGWGLPVAESLAHGKLCLSSNVSAMPEVAGDLIDYFSPFDPASLLEKLVTYLDPARREAREREIAQRYRPVSWHEVYRTIVEIVDRHRPAQ